VIDIKSFFSKRERFLILEISPGEIGASLISLDTDNNVVVHKTWDKFNWSNTSDRIRLKGNQKIIIAAHSILATTLSIPVIFDREFQDEPINEIELENLLAQSIGKIFNRCREEASKELKIDELDTILVGSKVIGFKIDGHKVVSPIGLKARRIEAVLELTFTTRDVFDKVNFLVTSGRDFFFTEMGRAEVLSLRKYIKPPFSLVVLEPDIAHFFILDRDESFPVIRRGLFRWNPDKMFSAISDAWGLDKDTAKRVYSVYIDRDMSLTVSKKIEKVLKPVVENFFDDAGKARLRGKVYINSVLPMPFDLPKRRAKFVFDNFPFAGLMEKLGLRRKIGIKEDFSYQILRRLASFAEFYYDNSERQINARLKRRLHWLHPVTPQK
jgi:hypothetical protein